MMPRIEVRHAKLLTLVAAAFMLLPLPIMQYVGEEGLMALKSYEMYVRGDWLHPSILGSIWPHSPLWHWPVMGICALIGWQHVDIAIRLVSVMATWSSAAVVGWSACWLLAEDRPERGWLAALVYLTLGEVSFWYGWLGYVDATFGFFIFAAIATLWRALRDEHAGWFLVSLLSISLAFMTKNITAYALLGVSGLVLMWRLDRWHVLKSPAFVLPALAALCVPWLWQKLVIIHHENNAVYTIKDALRNFHGYGLTAYLWHWFSYPMIFILRAMPISLFLLWLWLVRRQRWQRDDTLLNLALVLLACFLPFWLAAGGSPRYLVPLYGLFALLLSGLLLQLEGQRVRQGVMLAALIVLLKIPYSLVALPYIKDWMPGRNVKAVAREVIQLTKNAPLYSENNVASGLAIVAYIDVWRQDRPPVTWLPNGLTRAYVLTYKPTPELGPLIKSWVLRGDHVYLYWHEGH